MITFSYQHLNSISLFLFYDSTSMSYIEEVNL